MRAADRLVARTFRSGGPWLGVLLTTAIGGALLQLALPYVMGRTVDSLVAGGAGVDGWLLACTAVVAGVVACESLGIWATGATSAQASAWLRRSLLRHVLGTGPAMTRRLPEGDLVTRLGMNTEEVGRAPEALITTAALLLPTAGSLVALALIDVWLPFTLLAGLVLITLVLRAFLRDTTTLSAGYQKTQGDLASRLLDALGGARTIAAAGTADAEARRVLEPLPVLREHGMGLWRANARAGVQAGLAIPLLEVAVLAVGGLRLASGDLSVGELYAAARYVVLGAGFSAALGHVGRLARARAAAGRVAELLAGTPVEHGERPLPAGPGTLEFRGVSIGLDGKPVLDGLDLVLPGGTATAVVGRSGTGKSLLAALAGRLVDPERGTVLLDGVPLRDLPRDELRQAIGFAFERPTLMGGALDEATLEDAIALGLPTRDPEVVHAAAASARADTFIRQLPDGYATRLQDAPMSGGEKQRIGLARAFAQGRRLLVLDDATSSLDTVTEYQVGEALTGRLRGRTRLIVAHRVGTAARADRVVWLEDGRIRAYERHSVLWADPGYRAVFQDGLDTGCLEAG
ncbi:ABC transporter ATP-binding protein [Actinomadura rudentiformis]|uniref:ABC transporter ATP-binding protein n=1 Tax=Actinomadura rudentiformis TaxID=359158 RepID=A0A6H9YMG9_9ACTN|nr:ABC transporter ATP-binding protein [Actinomadura rudentiformis]KAB2339834.1 ABC transporter ATP-binding protein [Actinomadura rudentiformis]